MSSLWTPYGEHQPEEEGPAGPGTDPPPPGAGPRPGPDPGPDAGPDVEAEIDPEVAAQLAEARAQLAATPVTDIIANHAVGLWQLAIVHLAPEEGAAPRLGDARLAIDAMAALVDGLGDRLGANAGPLRDALAQLRLVYVQVLQATGGAGPDGPGASAAPGPGSEPAPGGAPPAG